MTETIELSSSAARARRYRERKRRGARVIPVEIYDDDVNLLIKGGFMDREGIIDRDEIALGIKVLLKSLTMGIMGLYRRQN